MSDYDIRVDPGTDYRDRFTIATRTDDGDTPWELSADDITMTVRASGWPRSSWNVPVAVTDGVVSFHMDSTLTSQLSHNASYYYIIDVRRSDGDIDRILRGNVYVSRGGPRG
jgi:hypothetical protein